MLIGRNNGKLDQNSREGKIDGKGKGGGGTLFVLPSSETIVVLVINGWLPY